MKTFWLIFWVSLLAVPALRSQEISSPNELAPLPKGDLIHKRAPEFSQWKVTSASSHGRASADVVLYTKAGKIIRVDRSGKYGPSTVWCTEGLEFLDSANGEAAEVTRSAIPDSENPYFTDLTKTDFPGFEWIQPSAYFGNKDYNGTTCLVFKKPQKNGGDQEIAFVDEKTRLPVALIRSSEILKFEWNAIPQVNLSLPQNVQRLLSHRLKALEQSMAPKIPPF